MIPGTPLRHTTFGLLILIMFAGHGIVSEAQTHKPPPLPDRVFSERVIALAIVDVDSITSEKLKRLYSWMNENEAEESLEKGKNILKQLKNFGINWLAYVHYKDKDNALLINGDRNLNEIETDLDLPKMSGSL